MQDKEPLVEWLQNAAGLEIAVNEDPLIEARQNWQHYFLSAEQAAKLTVEDLLAFVEQLTELLRGKLVSDHEGSEMLLYFWFDEMAGGLCSSLVSRSWDMALPFRCPIDRDARIEDIVERYIDSHYLEGIPFAELDTVVLPETDKILTSRILPVHVISLP
jgi:hypothetical protein